MMREGAPKTIYRKDYSEPDFLISHVELAFEIADGNTRVTSSLRIQRNGSHGRPLVLDGEGLGLISVSIDGGTLGGGRLQILRRKTHR
jgi:aminopeptidase N